MYANNLFELIIVFFVFSSSSPPIDRFNFFSVFHFIAYFQCVGTSEHQNGIPKWQSGRIRRRMDSCADSWRGGIWRVSILLYMTMMMMQQKKNRTEQNRIGEAIVQARMCERVRCNEYTKWFVKCVWPNTFTSKLLSPFVSQSTSSVFGPTLLNIYTYYWSIWRFIIVMSKVMMHSFFIFQWWISPIFFVGGDFEWYSTEPCGVK